MMLGSNNLNEGMDNNKGVSGKIFELDEKSEKKSVQSEQEYQTDEDVYTVEQAVDVIGFGKFQIKLSVVAGLAWMADATEMMILSVLAPALHCSWWLSSYEQAMLTTIVFCGMTASSSLWGYVSDRYGRKTALIVSALYTFYYGILSAFSPTYIWILVLRGLVGFGIGGAPQAVTLYSEFLPSTSRARCIVMIELAWALGAGFEVLLALVVMPTLGWRWLLIFSAFPLMVFAISCLWMPESARYHVTCGHTERAMETIRRIAAENNSPMPVGRLAEVTEAKSARRGHVKDLFVPEMRRTTLLLWLIWLVSAFAYYGIVLMTTEMFSGEAERGSCKVAGVETLEPAECLSDCRMLTTKDYTDLLWTTLAEFPGLLLTVVLIEKVGRKLTMVIQFVLFSVFVFLLYICTTRAVLTAFLFIARAVISGAFQAAYVYTPEVYPTTTRALGLGLCSGMARIGAITTPFVAQVMLRESSALAVTTYGAASLVAAAASLALPIETKGRKMTDVNLTRLKPK